MAESDKAGQPGSNGPVSNKGDKSAWPTETATRFHYDALDRLIGRTTSAGKEQGFYRNDELANELSGAVSTTFVRVEGVVLAECQIGGETHSRLLMCDDKNSVLGELTQLGLKGIAYSPYGHRTDEALLSSHLGYNGERCERQTGWYSLGNGYRVFNPRLMRFHSPDSLSPFGKGGVNAYMYCVGDPVNNVDPTGHTVAGDILRFFRVTTNSPSYLPGATSSPSSFLRTKANKMTDASIKTISLDDIEALKQRKLFYETTAAARRADHVTNLFNMRLERSFARAGHERAIQASLLASKEYEFAKLNRGGDGITKHSALDFKIIAEAYRRGVAIRSEAEQEAYFIKFKLSEEEMRNIRGTNVYRAPSGQ
ncbi:RHS repeat-associated core domain-containing protein [Pseudomonas sp. NFACC13-1]|uniref:RHS repeat-associated core domain-containing protein n=1 Tax=Pseudomonas sp. NFACC13-1 TaxID=1566245 RepID=UPI000882373E|nr:RHS repeat-associated core domain-containing protein [Pseudomonas sp. NFACC13-1]SDB41872.1 RHS repeat-associated core domain-containing protein [Pseudomonas sp. NFACC13-1]